MAKKLKNGKYINVNIDVEVYDMLVKHCEESGQTKTTAIERAIRNYCDKPKIMFVG